jgi:outer membrane protein, multidrug efflux system
MKLILITFAFWLTACSLIPELRELSSPVPSELPQTGGPGVVVTASEQVPAWKEFFRTPTLQRLIERGLAHNRDLRIALLNVEEVRARYRIERSQLAPSLAAEGSLNLRRIPENAFFAPAGAGGGVGGRAPEGFLLEQYGLDVGIASFELDLFGRIRSLNEAALREYLAADWAQAAAQVTLVSEIAGTYLELLGNMSFQKIAEDTVRTQEETVALIGRRQKAGVTSELELKQAETLLEAARADVLTFSNRVRLDLHALTFLTGLELKDLNPAEDLSTLAQAMTPLAVNLSSQSLLQRPDIRRAENMLLAANAEIGAARAAFFPTLALTTSVGKLSTEASNLFSGDSNTWAFFPRITLPIFTGGRLKAQRELAEVRKERSIAE